MVAGAVAVAGEGDEGDADGAEGEGEADMAEAVGGGGMAAISKLMKMEGPIVNVVILHEDGKTEQRVREPAQRRFCSARPAGLRVLNLACLLALVVCLPWCRKWT